MKSTKFYKDRFQRKAKLLRKWLKARPYLRVAVIVMLPLIAYTYGYMYGNNVSTQLDTQKKITEQQSENSPAVENLPPGILKGLEKATSGICKNTFKINVPEHSRSKDFRDACTHGPDTATALGVDSSARISTSSGSPPCFGDGVSGRRVQALYVVASDQPDRYDEFRDSFASWAGRTDSIIDISGRKTGSELHAKWYMPGCVFDVAKVVVPPTGDDYIAQTVAEVRNAGYTDQTRKYLMWTDASLYCGIAGISNDDRNDPTLNRNNGGPHYARVDTSCWGYGSVEVHELFHNLGAVQLSAPNSSGGYHCVDEYDRLCYKDSAGVELRYDCPVDQANLLDCNNDDYLHSDPEPGSYLATNWNTYDSGFLYSEEPNDTNPPPSPVLELVDNQPGKVVFDWNDVQDPEGSDVTYRIIRGTFSRDLDTLASVGVSEYTDYYASAESFYDYYVLAIDEFGNTSQPSNTVKVQTIDVTDPSDTTPPPAVSNLRTSSVTPYGFTLTWDTPSDISDIKELGVELSTGITKNVSPGTTSSDFCCSLIPSTTYSVRVKSVDAAGNYSYSETKYQSTSAAPAPPPGSVVPYNLQLVSENGSELKFSATIDSTTDGTKNYFYRLRREGMSTYISHFFPSKTTSSTYTLTDPNVLPQAVSGYYISVHDYATNVEVNRSTTLGYSYSGSSESNVPSDPSGFSFSVLSATSAKVSWSASSDDSGKVYRYPLTTTSPSGYSNARDSYLSSLNLYGLVSGDTYTMRVRARDIWDNYSNEAVYQFVMP